LYLQLKVQICDLFEPKYITINPHTNDPIKVPMQIIVDIIPYIIAK